MLSHQHRFHGHGSLRYVYKNGNQVRNNLMSFKYTSNKHRLHSRFAIIVSKKIYKSAVKRNRIRRRIYEIIRKNLPDIKESQDIVITIFDKSVIETPPSELENSVHSLLEKAGLLR